MICGKRVGLRPVLEDDLPLVARWRDGEFVDAMFYSFARASKANLRVWFAALVSDASRMRFMVQRLEDAATVGIVGLEHIDYRNQVAELAGLIIDPAERKQGWGTAALATLITYGFDDLNLRRLYARIYAPNRAALCVAEKAGLKSEGVARQAVFADGSYQDVIHMALLRDEWKHEPTATTIH